MKKWKDEALQTNRSIGNKTTTPPIFGSCDVQSPTVYYAVSDKDAVVLFASLVLSSED